MRLCASFCVLLAIGLPAFGAAKKQTSKPPSAASVQKMLIQMERDWVRAAAAKDTATVERILADDWTSTDFRGKTVTKPEAVRELGSAASAGPSMDLGEMKVRVFGTTAVVNGRDRTGKYGWMDVFLKRNGKWQAVASQSTRIEP